MLWFHPVWWITWLQWREGASSESFLHSPPPQHVTFPPILYSNNPGWWNDSLWGIRKGHLCSLAWRDHKRSSCLSACPGQDGDAVADRFLSNKFLKTSATSQGMLSHNISTSLHMSLLPVKTINSCPISSKHRKQILFFFPLGFWMNVFLTTSVTSEKHQGISSSQRFFPVTIALTSKHSWILFLKKIRILLRILFLVLFQWMCLHTVSSFAADSWCGCLQSPFKLLWLSMSVSPTENRFQGQNSHCFQRKQYFPLHQNCNSPKLHSYRNHKTAPPTPSLSSLKVTLEMRLKQHRNKTGHLHFILHKQ